MSPFHSAVGSGPRPAPPERTGKEESLTLSFDVGLPMVEGILTLADEWSANLGAHKDDRISLRLVLEELLLNLCMHAGGAAKGGEIKADLAISPVYAAAHAPQDAAHDETLRLQSFILTLRDTGPEFNPLTRERGKIGTIQDTAPGGQGLALVRLLAMKLEYRRHPGSNHLTLVLACNGPGTASRPDPAPSTNPFARRTPGQADGGMFRRLARAWNSRLPVRQAALFFSISLIMLWGGLFFYYATTRDSREDASWRLCAQALHTQDISSSSFLNRLSRNFAVFMGELEKLPEYATLLDNNDAFFNELRNGILVRSLMADTAVLGVLKGERGVPGAMLLYRTGERVSRLTLPTDFGPFISRRNAPDSPDKLGEPGWAGPLRDLPGEAGHGHAGMLIAKTATSASGKDTWIGLVITMPWILKTLDALSGFAHVASVFVTEDAEYVVYPPGRKAQTGPQSLRDEAGDDVSPGMRALLDAIKNRGRGVVPLASVFPGGESPWPLPWKGPTSLAYAPMTIPGWSFIILVSSGDIGATPPPVPTFMPALALAGPFLMALLAWILSARVIRPLRSLSEALYRIADGDLDTPLPPPRARDEISGMLLAFERVRVTLKQSFANMMEATAAEQRVRNELALARSIQESMLPAEPPDVPGARVAASIDMAGEVCGDLFDYFTLPGSPETLYCLIGDVCGKGIPASVIMSRAMVLARSALLAGGTPSGTLARLNKALLRHNEALMFVTLLVARLDTATGIVTWASAGHPPPMAGPVSRDGKPPATGSLPWSRDLVLGIKPGVHYTEQTVHLAPGQSLLLYTDGVDEAMAPCPGGENPTRPGGTEGMRIFGEEQLRNAFFEACGKEGEADMPPPGTVLEHIRAAVLSHMGEAPPCDDISLIVLRWDGPEP